jgi:hypothetical protein
MACGKEDVRKSHGDRNNQEGPKHRLRAAASLPQTSFLFDGMFGPPHRRPPDTRRFIHILHRLYSICVPSIATEMMLFGFFFFKEQTVINNPLLQLFQCMLLNLSVVLVSNSNYVFYKSIISLTLLLFYH